MIQSPFRIEEQWPEEDFVTIGRFVLRWALIEHVLKNCLRQRLGLSLDQANLVVYPLYLNTVLEKIDRLHKTEPMPVEATELYSEIKPIVRALQPVRNDAVHSVLKETETGFTFENRAKGRSRTMEEIANCEDLTCYVSAYVLAFRGALGFKEGPPPPDPLPSRPATPDFLDIKFPAC